MDASFGVCFVEAFSRFFEEVDEPLQVPNRAYLYRTMCITNRKSDLNCGNPTIEMLGERSISNNTDNASTLKRDTG
jgi:hypothetical protein